MKNENLDFGIFGMISPVIKSWHLMEISRKNFFKHFYKDEKKPLPILNS